MNSNLNLNRQILKYHYNNQLAQQATVLVFSCISSSSLGWCLLLDIADLAVAIRKYMLWMMSKEINTPPMTRNVLKTNNLSAQQVDLNPLTKSYYD